jgi:hypothetical protein
VFLHSSLLTKLLLLPQVLLPRVLLVDEDLDNSASKWFTWMVNKELPYSAGIKLTIQVGTTIQGMKSTMVLEK